MKKLTARITNGSNFDTSPKLFNQEQELPVSVPDWSWEFVYRRRVAWVNIVVGFFLRVGVPE